VKDATLLTVASLVGMTMWLENSESRRTADGYTYTATVAGEATIVSPFGSRDTRTASGTASGETPHGAMLLAYAACMRAFIARDPFPEAFVRDIERLEE
jgi:hypothetical protein